MKKNLMLIMLLSSTMMFGHAVWIEKDKALAKAYFGEWAEDKREVSGKLLDYIKAPKAFLGVDKTPLTLTKEANHFAIPVTGSGDVRLVEDTLKVGVNKTTNVKTKGFYIAKYGRTETKAVTDLELVPDAAGSNSFTLFLKGAPLPKAPVHVFGPPRWQKEFFTDAQGKVTIETPWSGPYFVEVEHLLKAAGGSGDDAYDQARYVFTLFFETAKGIRWK
ncbi:hypothetical protein [Bryobacter aggregatus]|uniref:hypothetical protein n=1 Tax=Bryobacter aggregatus TaxID=360054 RepID=UPI00068E27A5|nr:hypothetical protein [Bryobacter aggregatus]